MRLSTILITLAIVLTASWSIENSSISDQTDISDTQAHTSVDPYLLSKEEVKAIYKFEQFAHFAFMSAKTCSENRAFDRVKDLYTDIMRDNLGYTETYHNTLALFEDNEPEDIPETLKASAVELGRVQRGTPNSIAVWLEDKFAEGCIGAPTDFDRMKSHAAKLMSKNWNSKRCTQETACAEISLVNWRTFDGKTKRPEPFDINSVELKDRSVDPMKLSPEQISLIWAADRSAHVAFASALGCPRKRTLPKVTGLYKRVYIDELGYTRSGNNTLRLFEHPNIEEIPELSMQKEEFGHGIQLSARSLKTSLKGRISTTEPCLYPDQDFRTFEKHAQLILSTDWDSKRCSTRSCKEINVATWSEIRSAIVRKNRLAAK